MYSRSFATARPPFRPASRASSRENSCAVPRSWAAFPPRCAISRCLSALIAANPRAFVCASVGSTRPSAAATASVSIFSSFRSSLSRFIVSRQSTPRAPANGLAIRDAARAKAARSAGRVHRLRGRRAVRAPRTACRSRERRLVRPNGASFEQTTRFPGFPPRAPLPLRLPHHEHRPIRMIYDLRSGRPEQVIERVVPVRADHDEVDVVLLR
jgi:hypothetical protein